MTIICDNENESFRENNSLVFFKKSITVLVSVYIGPGDSVPLGIVYLLGVQ